MYRGIFAPHAIQSTQLGVMYHVASTFGVRPAADSLRASKESPIYFGEAQFFITVRGGKSWK